MNKAAKIGILAGAFVFTVLTAALLFAGIASAKVDKKTKTYDSLESFTSIKIDTDVTDIDLKVGDKAKVVCEETTKEVHHVSVSDNTLNIKFESKRKFYEQMFSFGQNLKVTVYLPSISYNDLTIANDTGDINISSLNFKTVSITSSTGNLSLDKVSVAETSYFKASTGSVKLNEVTTKSLEVNTSTGNINLTKVTVLDNMKASASTGNVKMNNVLVAKKMTVKTSTGNIEAVDSDAESLSIEASTGNVKLGLLTDKIIFPETSTGSADYPHLTSGGKCEIKTSTGNIKVTIKGR